ncbi:MAG: regulatory protein RecX [Chloroflexi bacterium]|nr:MAG: regulatory protein RecX [Chloroflexota bacterium]
MASLRLSRVISGRKRHRPRESIAEGRARRGAIDDPEVVLAAALRFLEARPRSAAEVRRRLTGAGYREELVAGAIERLAELGILDDEAFARAWIESRDRARPRGERALRSELFRKGIDRQLADDVLDERATEQPDADAAAARRVLERHANALARVADPRARRQRAYALLARSGFDSETAVEAIAATFPRDSEG